MAVRPNLGVYMQEADLNWSTFSAAEVRSELVGGWYICSWQFKNDDWSLQFTADGRWFVLVDDGHGGRTRSTLTGSALSIRGYDAGTNASGGTYTFQDLNRDPLGPDGGVVFVATGGVWWFRPEFALVEISSGPALAGRLMVVTFSDLSKGTFVSLPTEIVPRRPPTNVRLIRE